MLLRLPTANLMQQAPGVRLLLEGPAGIQRGAQLTARQIGAAARNLKDERLMLQEDLSRVIQGAAAAKSLIKTKQGID